MAASSTILSLWYDSTWDWTPVFRAIGEHSTHQAITVANSTWIKLYGKIPPKYTFFSTKTDTVNVMKNKVVYTSAKWHSLNFKLADSIFL